MIKTNYILVIVVIVCLALASSVFLIPNVNEKTPDALVIDDCNIILNRDILEDSLNLGNQFLKNNQKPAGNFNYEYDWINKEQNPADSEVRQAGALWGLSLIYQYTKNETLIPYIQKGFDFFDKNSISSNQGTKWIHYPDSSNGRTGTVALLCLSIIDFLRAADDINASYKEKLDSDLDKYLAFLISVRDSNGQFHQSYNPYLGEGYGDPSPYFDGESLLAIIKAVKYLDKTDYKEFILESAYNMYMTNIEDALKENPDSSTTKGFYQWGSMSYYEIATGNWIETKGYDDLVIYLANWMIDVHRTLDRTKNTAYAYEGIIHAYELARLKNDEINETKFRCVIDEGLYKLTSWQVGGPIPNEFLQDHRTTDELAIGGVMNSKDEPPLRIDVTQHQMHAVILALKYVYL